MSQRRRMPNKRQQRSNAPPPPPIRTASVKKAPTKFGPPFVLLEDNQARTFIFSSGTWVEHSMSIADCRAECQVKVLPQKVNGMSRYEIRCPVDFS